MKQEEIFIKSTLDGTMQPSVLYRSENAGRPLLVGLHTWRYDRFNQVYSMVESAEKYDFNLILPEFRGPNLRLLFGTDFPVTAVGTWKSAVLNEKISDDAKEHILSKNARRLLNLERSQT